MELNVPNHHVKGEICATRPAYREGRIPKAVKVYTVASESKYLLIQNVPSVGAKEELLKLCSTFGPLEDHHILDEYPSQDKYTEVYLLKYQKINSSRFAKRKLDDHSFFGGTLHVCYAPEYESVEETREKLQERRRIVARKISQYYGNKKKEFHETNLRSNDEQGQKSNYHVGSTPLGTGTVPKISQKKLPQSSVSMETAQNIVSNEDVNPLNPVSLEPSNQTVNVCGSEINTCVPRMTFSIPPPPKPSAKYQKQKNEKYEFARVRSHHASLPLGNETCADEYVHSKNEDKISDSPVDSYISANDEGVAQKFRGSKEPVIIKNYKISKPTLRFVPRQTVKRNADEAGHNVKDLDNVMLKKNAFLLGNVQGPADIPGRRVEKPNVNSNVEHSYRNTISAIRSKISKVISDNVKPQS